MAGLLILNLNGSSGTFYFESIEYRINSFYFYYKNRRIFLFIMDFKMTEVFTCLLLMPVSL